MAGELEAFPAKTKATQQARCDKCLHESHRSSLGTRLEGVRTSTQDRRAPVVQVPTYRGCALRRVSKTGSVRLNSDRAFLSGVLAGFVVGPQAPGGFRYRVRYYDYDLGIVEIAPFDAIVSPLERLQALLVSIAETPVTSAQLPEAAGNP